MTAADKRFLGFIKWCLVILGFIAAYRQANGWMSDLCVLFLLAAIAVVDAMRTCARRGANANHTRLQLLSKLWAFVLLRLGVRR